MIRQRQPVDRMLPEPKMLLSVVGDGSHVVMGLVELLVVIGGCVVEMFLTLKLLD